MKNLSRIQFSLFLTGFILILLLCVIYTIAYSIVQPHWFHIIKTVNWWLLGIDGAAYISFLFVKQ